MMDIEIEARVDEQPEAQEDMLDLFKGLLFERQGSIDSVASDRPAQAAAAVQRQPAQADNAVLVRREANPDGDCDDNYLAVWFDQVEAETEGGAKGTEEEEMKVSNEVKFCEKALECGHQCYGCSTAKKCLPCLEPGCKSAKESKEELCSICFTTELGSDPCVELGCGHVFHLGCVKDLLKHRWSTLKITFAFMSCPSCKTPFTSIDSQHLQEELAKLLKLKEKIESEVMKVAQNQGILQDERLSTPGDHYFERPLAFALYKCSFYECAKCVEPFFGGLVDCEQEMAQEEQKNVEKEKLRCQLCLLEDFGAGQKECKEHGTSDIDWKCSYCCSVALFHCGGTMYCCDPCHEEYMGSGGRVVLKDCGGKNCPLNVRHPPASEKTGDSLFPLGCGLCRTIKLDQAKDKIGIMPQQTEEAFVVKIWEKYKRPVPPVRAPPQPAQQPAPQRRAARPARNRPARNPPQEVGNNLAEVRLPNWFVDPDDEEDLPPMEEDEPQQPVVRQRGPAVIEESDEENFDLFDLFGDDAEDVRVRHPAAPHPNRLMPAIEREQPEADFGLAGLFKEDLDEEPEVDEPIDAEVVEQMGDFFDNFEDAVGNKREPIAEVDEPIDAEVVEQMGDFLNNFEEDNHEQNELLPPAPQDGRPQLKHNLSCEEETKETNEQPSETQSNKDQKEMAASRQLKLALIDVVSQLGVHTFFMRQAARLKALCKSKKSCTI